jgi:hypothetical protein
MKLPFNTLLVVMLSSIAPITSFASMADNCPDGKNLYIMGGIHQATYYTYNHEGAYFEHIESIDNPNDALPYEYKDLAYKGFKYNKDKKTLICNYTAKLYEYGEYQGIVDFDLTNHGAY